MYFTGLSRVLDGTGLPHTLVAGWESRTAHRGGLNRCLAVFYHTTESADAAFRTGRDAPTLGYVTGGLGYPLYNFLIGRSGRVYLVAAGTAAHAGVGRLAGIPNNDGNRHALSISFDANSWGYPVTAAQLESGARLGAALDADWGGTLRHVMHGEWAPGRRSDPTRIPGGWPALKAAVSRGYWTLPAQPGPALSTTTRPAPAPVPVKKKEPTMSKAIVLDALEDFRVPYFNHAADKYQQLPLAESLKYLSVANGKILDAQAELAGQVGGLQAAVKALADDAGQDGQAILDTITAITRETVQAALPAAVTVPLEAEAH